MTLSPPFNYNTVIRVRKKATLLEHNHLYFTQKLFNEKVPKKIQYTRQKVSQKTHKRQILQAQQQCAWDSRELTFTALFHKSHLCLAASQSASVIWLCSPGGRPHGASVFLARLSFSAPGITSPPSAPHTCTLIDLVAHALHQTHTRGALCGFLWDTASHLAGVAGCEVMCLFLYIHEAVQSVFIFPQHTTPPAFRFKLKSSGSLTGLPKKLSRLFPISKYELWEMNRLPDS